MNDYQIYPKQFRRIHIPVEKNRCFVIMPFKDEFDYVYGNIKDGLQKAGYICNRVDEIPGAIPIMNKILTEILRSQFIIADLTGCNPNVFYELGIAHTFKDVQNIIILKQKSSSTPFDITHITYIEYDPTNPFYLISNITKTISECKYLSDFYDSLNTHGLISYIGDNCDDVIGYFLSGFKELVLDITIVFNGELEFINENLVARLLSKYEILLSKVIADKQDDLMFGLFRILQELIISTASYPAAQVFLSDFLSGSYLDSFQITNETKLSWVTDMAVTIAKANKLLPIVMPWIINYFSRTKTANIDLNRYKVEAFLMSTENQIIDDILCDTIFNPNCYIREHIADIIGEKRMTGAVGHICRQLLCEENYYTAISLIEALGKLGDTSAIFHITNWVSAHETRIISEKQFFVIKHARAALLRLIKDTKSITLTEFDAKYQTYLSGYFML